MLYPDEDGVLQPHPIGLVDETNDAYHSGPGISKSHLDVIASSSPLHYWHKYLNPEREREEPTRAMIIGSAIHSAILEPDLFPSEYVASPGFDRRSTKGRENAEAFAAEHKGKVVLEPEDFSMCLTIRDRVHNHPVAGGLLVGGRSEQSFYAIDSETGELIKCRTDYLHDSGHLIVDIKSTEDASPDGFGRSCVKFRYPVQTAWYQHVLRSAYGECPQHWAFVAVEKEPPFAVGVYFPTPEQIDFAAHAARRDFLRIVEHRRAGVWPDFTPVEPLPLSLPNWVKY
jgi:exodeoxyribonuclease VIII